MITDWFERRRLVLKGLACDKTRRGQSEDTLQSWADCSWKLRLALLSIFLMLLHVGVAWGHFGRNNVEDQILAFIIFIAGLMLIEIDSPSLLKSNARLTLALYFEPEQHVLPMRGEIGLKGMETAISFLGQAGVIKPPLPPAERFMDLQYLRAAGLQE